MFFNLFARKPTHDASMSPPALIPSGKASINLLQKRCNRKASNSNGFLDSSCGILVPFATSRANLFKSSHLSGNISANTIHPNPQWLPLKLGQSNPAPSSSQNTWAVCSYSHPSGGTKVSRKNGGPGKTKPWLSWIDSRTTRSVIMTLHAISPAHRVLRDCHHTCILEKSRQDRFIIDWKRSDDEAEPRNHRRCIPPT